MTAYLFFVYCYRLSGLHASLPCISSLNFYWFKALAYTTLGKHRKLRGIFLYNSSERIQLEVFSSRIGLNMNIPMDTPVFYTYRDTDNFDVSGVDLCISSNTLRAAAASRQRHSESQIHTPFGIQ